MISPQESPTNLLVFQHIYITFHQSLLLDWRPSVFHWETFVLFRNLPTLFLFFCVFVTVNKRVLNIAFSRRLCCSVALFASGVPPIQTLLNNYKSNKNTNTLPQHVFMQHSLSPPIFPCQLILQHTHNLMQFLLH